MIDQPHLSDAGNAQRLVWDWGHVLRYVHNRRRWIAWGGKRWEWDETGQIWRMAGQSVQNMYEQASRLDDQIERTKLAKHALRTEFERQIRAMVELTKSAEAIAITDAALDTNPWLLNVENGTVDLRTGALRDHQAEDMLTHCLPVPYDPKAKCSRWLSFLDRIFAGDKELIEFVQRAIGYSLTGSTREQCFFLCYGKGANGKSTLLETIATLLGSLAQTARFESFLAKRTDSIPNDIARMKGARFITAVEAESDRRLAESQLKQLTGGDTVSARFMRGEFFDFTPTFKLFLACNHRPIIRGTDHAMWRRVRLIPFEVTIPEDEQDPDLKQKLMDELPGILRWAIEGCLLWRKSGLGTCDAVERHTSAYREESDVLGPFLAEECVLGPDESVSKSDLYGAYKRFSEANNDKPLSKRAFGTRLVERQEEISDERTGRERRWLGVGLRSVTQ